MEDGKDKACCEGCAALKKQVDGLQKRLDELAKNFNEHHHDIPMLGHGHVGTIEPREQYQVVPF